MANFPVSLDNDVSIPRADNNITELSSDIINAIRSAVFAVESNLGIGANGSLMSVAARLNVALQPNGQLNPSVLINLLTSISITDVQVSPVAAIQESKIALSYSTASLYNMFLAVNNSFDILNGLWSLYGVQIAPHIAGTAYNHDLTAILIDPVSAPEYTNRFLTNRDTINANTLLLDINTDFVDHQRADGTSPSPPYAIGTFNTLNNEVVPSNYAHAGSGIHIDTSSFATIPQADTDLQSFAEEVDVLLGSSIQNLFANGIIRASNTLIIGSDGYAEPVVPVTLGVITHLLGEPPASSPSSSPVDDINTGDDVITFPAPSSTTFDAQFSQVRPGDIITVNYGNGVAAQFAIDSVKSFINGTTRVYAVRIIGKNLYSSSNASARIDRSLFHTNKYGILSASRAAVINNGGQSATSDYESMIISNPKGAIALGIGFNPSAFDQAHYNLYLTLYPDGNPADQVINFPPIDVTGNHGQTPGAYTLDSIVNATNLAFRRPGYNYRFVAFEYQGNFGVALADSYNNAAFSIIGNTVDGYGNYLPTLGSYANNAVDGYNLIDPLGFGPSGANVASPPYAISYSTPIAAALAPTLIFYPLRKNFYYIDGTERDSLRSDPSAINQIVDSFGDGYWPATITSVVITGSTVSTSYTIDYDLATSGLENGKTIVVQPAFLLSDPRYSSIDYGRFIITSITFSGCYTLNPTTTITVYDSVCGTGTSPYVTSNGIPVNIYFSDDSVSFDAENVADTIAEGPFKRFFELYVDQNGHTFTHERARFLTGISGISNLNFVDVSTKLSGFLTNSSINQKALSLNISSFTPSNGVMDGYLSNGLTNLGPLTSGKQGEVVRFYDDTNIDYIDFIFNVTTTINSFTDESITIQLFPSLELDQQFFLLATCQIDDNTKLISNLTDRRQFGNVSEAQLSDSAIDFINAYAKYSGQNGIVRGFDYITTESNQVSFTGGVALVNGALQNVNNFVVNIPIVQDNNGGSPISGVLWCVCINDIGEAQLIPLTDYNPAVNAINNPGRQLQLFNPATSLAYFVDSSTFTYIVNNRKDLAIVALVIAQVAGTAPYLVSITEPDARKYITDGNGNIPMVYSADSSQGNFKSIYAMMSWAQYNSSVQSICVIRGATILESDPGFVSGLTVQGEANASLTLSTSLTINETNFTNIAFTVSGGITVSNAIFTNCTFNALSEISVGSNCSFINCTFLANNVSQVSPAIVLGSSAQNISFTGCTANYVPTALNNVSPNWINSGNGFIYCSATTLQNLKITDCSFTTNIQTTAIIARYPFINIEYKTQSAVAQNIYIQRNKFYNTSSFDDMYAVIAIVSTLTTALSVQGMKLIDCVISDNLCDKDQMIAITCTPDVSYNINIGIIPISTTISGNSCGTIGLIGMADPYGDGYESYTNGIAYDKAYGITISNNTCRFVASLQSLGQFATGSLGSPSLSANTVTFMMCSTNIINNNCSWIQVSAATPLITTSLLNATVNILSNTLRGYNPAYLNNFGTTFSGNFAILLNNTTASYVPAATVKNNTIMTGTYLTNTGTSISYDYSYCIFTYLPTIIDGNLLSASLTSGAQASADMMYIFPQTGICTITNNIFYRNSVHLNSYIRIDSGSSAIVTNNTFDSTTIDGISKALIAGPGTAVGTLNNINYLNSSTGAPIQIAPYTRTIAQPLLLSQIGASAYITANSGYLDDGGGNDTSTLMFTKVINGAILDSVSISWASLSGTPNGTSNVSVYYAISGAPVRIGSSQPGPTGTGTGTITFGSLNALIDDSSSFYYISIHSESGVSIAWHNPVCRFINITTLSI